MDNYAFSVETYLLLQFLRWMIISWNQVIAYVRCPAGVKIFTERQNQIIWLQKKKKALNGLQGYKVYFISYLSVTNKTNLSKLWWSVVTVYARTGKNNSVSM